MARPVYLDAAATTPVDPRVGELVSRLFLDDFGNAGSRTHGYGLDAKREVATARGRIASAVDADPDDVVFTSGATEADNLAILGLAAHGMADGRRHLVSTAIEHKAVLEPLARLASEGFEVTLIKPDRRGHVAAIDVLEAVRPDTLLVSVMHANNETGAVQPIVEIADGLLGHPTTFLHVDAAQSFGRLTKDLANQRIDMISLSGHKTFAPKGVGALVVRRRDGRRVPLRPLMLGGGQERGLRPGTLPVPLIAGFGLAAELGEKESRARSAICGRIRTEALAAFARLDAIVHVEGDHGVLPNILSVCVPGIDSEALMVALKEDAALSNGSACTSTRYEASHVLRAMELTDEVVSGTVRFSWSHATRQVDWPRIVARLEDLRV